MDASLQVVSGEIFLPETDGPPLRLVDVLSQLPLPTDDLSAFRTWPAAPESGWLELDPHETAGRYSFYAILPRRYDASGAVPGRGLFANGLWHPQPVVGGTLPLVQWEAEVRLPDGAVGALNTTAGEGVLRWSGAAERLSLAVLPGGQIREIPLKAGRLRVVDSQKRPALDAHLTETLEGVWPGPSAPDLLVVVTPSRRRLTRPGPGVLFLSDRAFRVSGGLWRYHVQAVRLGLLTAGLPIPDPWLRALAAGALLEQAPPPPSLERSLGWFSWIPQVDALLYDGQLPFFSDVFSEVWPSDPVADDLQEIVQRQAPGRAVAHRIDAIYGEGSALRLARALVAGSSLHEASRVAGVPPVALQEWRRWPAPQDFLLSVQQGDGGTWQAQVQREAADSAPIEPVTLDVDGIRRRLLLGPGPDQGTLDLPARPRVVRLDPDGALLQTERGNDRWPNRWTTIFYLSPDEINLAQRRISGSVNLAVRKQHDTRWRYGLGVYTSPETLVGGSLSVARAFGPLIDRRYRPLGVWMGLGGAMLDPAFRPTDTGRLAIEGFAGIDYDTRYVNHLARSGYRVALSGTAGQVPESQQQWRLGQLTAQGLVPLGGRFTLASRAKLGLASGDVEHRLLNLGGTGAVQGLSFDDAVGNQRLIASSELRWIPLQHASVPLPLMWISTAQLSGGIDAGAIRRTDPLLPEAFTQQQALGWSAGLAFVADVLGADPNFGGLWIAGPLYPSTTSAENLQLYLRISQPF